MDFQHHPRQGPLDRLYFPFIAIDLMAVAPFQVPSRGGLKRTDQPGEKSQARECCRQLQQVAVFGISNRVLYNICAMAPLGYCALNANRSSTPVDALRRKPFKATGTPNIMSAKASG